MADGSAPVNPVVDQYVEGRPSGQTRGAVFLDRDGVLIEDVHYLVEVRQVRLTVGAAEAVASLNRAGIPVIVVTNQAGVARGYFGEERVREVHAYLDELLAEECAKVDRFYYCPHRPDAKIARYRIPCDCRKPKPGMLRRAAAELGLDLANSYLVGDKVSDLAAGGAAGCKTMLVRTGHGASVDPATADAQWNLVHVAADLSEAVRRLLPAMMQARKKSA
jgi:D-glycero-D-manno-heptose 1,7-bisphosphate phosphatase